MLIDTHAHLDFPEFDADRIEVVERARASGVDRIINIGSSLKGSRNSVELAREYDCIFATVGIHPHDADGFTDEQYGIISKLAREKKVVAIGEIGLDMFKNFSKADNQRPMFIRLLGLAKELDLPVVIHSRQAETETLEFLKNAMPIRGVVHCFSGDDSFMQACLDMGFYISFTCNITYKKADGLRALVKKIPLDRLFLETDAPYLSPEGFRGKRNEPYQVKLLAEEIARIRECSLEEVGKATSESAIKFFKL
jgi:TatD DNase family protein